MNANTDLKEAIDLLKQLDELSDIEELLTDHNGHRIININALYEKDEELATNFDELELAAPFLFLNVSIIESHVNKLLKDNGFYIKRGIDNDKPYIYYIVCGKFDFGISES